MMSNTYPNIELDVGDEVLIPDDLHWGRVLGQVVRKYHQTFEGTPVILYDVVWAAPEGPVQVKGVTLHLYTTPTLYERRFDDLSQDEVIYLRVLGGLPAPEGWSRRREKRAVHLLRQRRCFEYDSTDLSTEGREALRYVMNKPE